jgi:hypothetical protein
MFRKRYRINQLMVETITRTINKSVVKFIVNVRLMEKSVNSHVGNVMVEKVMTQYRTLGMAWKKKEKTHPIHPAMVVGTGGKGGGGRWEML